MAGRQLMLDVARRPMGHGGWRPGAGRPRTRSTPAHCRRPVFKARIPQHVTMRLVPGLDSLRRGRFVRVVHAVLIAAGCRPDFRVVQFNVMSNHLHLIVEARDEKALARGMHALAIRLAHRINAVMGRRGALFLHRYHSHALKTPRETRNALRYVLLNARHHAKGRLAPGIDPCSSGPWFGGWREATACEVPPWLDGVRQPTAPAETWLLKYGWQRAGGAIALDEI